MFLAFRATINTQKQNIWRNHNRFIFMENKKCKIMPKIGTHDGNFHCDEILACYMLQQIDDYKDAEIIRSRDLNVLKTCDIVIDVGREFNVSENKFDHHQKDFNETLSSLRPELGSDYDIRLSSAGLIYTYFGEKVITNILKKEKNLVLSNDSIRLVYKKVYESFIKEIDAIDNGIPVCDSEPRYYITTHLSARIGHLYPSWNCEDKSIDVMKQFEKGKTIAGDEFNDKIIYYSTVWLPARKIVSDAIENAENVHESGEIIELSIACPWKDHFFDLEKELNLDKKIKYVLFKNDENDWRVMCVPHKQASFVCRKFLHKDWRGCSASQIAELSGIKDVQFCHSTGFIGGAATRDSVFKMAVQSLNGKYED